jgi:ribosomal protein S18 acetylase RimI-like enzyme
MSDSSSSGTTEPAGGDGWRIDRHEPASDTVVQGLRQCLEAYNAAVAGVGADSRSMTWVVRDTAGELIGGLAGEIRYGWLHIRLLWVNPERRGDGAGRALLDRAERVARANGMLGLVTDTSSFQAPGFYIRHGFTVIGELPDLPPGHTTYYLAKRLDPTPSAPTQG